MFPGEIHDLHHLRLGDLIGVDAAFADTVIVHLQHDPRRRLAILLEEALQRVDHEFHRRIVVVEQKDTVERRLLELGLDTRDHRYAPAAGDATAFVVAATGVPVAKHGNRALSSKSGAADVLAALGINIELGPDKIAQAIREAGLGFMFAPMHHAAMKHVGPTRVELGTRTIFNLLGPLSNPASVRRALLGVFSRDWVEPVAHVLKQLGMERAWVVHGSDGLDEVTTTGPTHVASLEGGKVTTFDIDPQSVDISIADPAYLKGADAEHNAIALRGVLNGDRGPYRDIVLMNAGAALVVAGKADTLQAGVNLAAEAIDCGAAMERLAKLVEVTNG